MIQLKRVYKYKPIYQGFGKPDFLIPIAKESEEGLTYYLCLKINVGSTVHPNRGITAVVTRWDSWSNPAVLLEEQLEMVPWDIEQDVLDDIIHSQNQVAEASLKALNQNLDRLEMLTNIKESLTHNQSGANMVLSSEKDNHHENSTEPYREPRHVCPDRLCSNPSHGVGTGVR